MFYGKSFDYYKLLVVCMFSMINIIKRKQFDLQKVANLVWRLYFAFTKASNYVFRLLKTAKTMTQEQKDLYWKKNITTVLSLLSIWFLVSFVFGILAVDLLNSIRIGGFKLGFWFAQQGSIYVFVVLIFIYVRLMNTLDKKYNVNE